MELPVEVKTNDIYYAASLMHKGAMLSSVDDYLSGNFPDRAKPSFELLLVPTYGSNILRTPKDYLKYLYYDLKTRFPDTLFFQFSDEDGNYWIDSRYARIKRVFLWK